MTNKKNNNKKASHSLTSSSFLRFRILLHQSDSYSEKENKNIESQMSLNLFNFLSPPFPIPKRVINSVVLFNITSWQTPLFKRRESITSWMGIIQLQNYRIVRILRANFRTFGEATPVLTNVFVFNYLKRFRCYIDLPSP